MKWRENRTLLLPFGVCLLPAVILLLVFSREDVHLAIDAHHSPVADAFFSLVTNLGDGWSVVALVLILLFVRYRDAILMASVNIASGLMVQLLKHGPFKGSVRPVEYFRGLNALHIVRGIEMYSYNSFPSGHAATACASCFCLGLMASSPWTKAALSLAGLLIAFSRVYLSQHFLGDVCAGALLGLLISVSFALALEYYGRNAESIWMEQSLIRR